jgi:FAD-dependent urate hydroxylase
VLIIGGRQSAYEWAALISERVPCEIHIVHNHETPAFAQSDWSFVDGLIEDTLSTRGWFRHLPAEERDAISKRFWSEGRLKLEPWLAARIERNNITDWPVTHVVEYRQEPTGAIVAVLSSKQRITVDHVVLATGYRVQVPAVPYLARTHLAGDLHTVDGCPVLDERLPVEHPRPLLRWVHRSARLRAVLRIRARLPSRRQDHRLRGHGPSGSPRQRGGREGPRARHR